MKKSPMVSVIRFLLLVLCCSCVSEDSGLMNLSAQRYQIQGEGYLFTADLSKYQRLDFNRKDPSICQVNFEIRKVSRAGNELRLELNRPKGCPAVYELVWDGMWQESVPRRMQVYLTAQFANCPGGTAMEADVIRVDLAKATRTTAPLDPFTVYLREHCSFRDFNCVGNCDLNIPD